MLFNLHNLGVRIMVNVRALVIALLMSMLLASGANAATWTPQSVAAFGPDFVARNVFFHDANTGWIVGADNGPTLFSDHTPKIWATTDGGLNWTQQASGTNGDVMDVHFISSQVGWTSGRDNGTHSTRWTTDGGSTWNLVNHGGSNFLLDVAAVDASKVWAVGDTDKVRYSSDGGQTWSDQTLPGLVGSPQVSSIEMLSATTGFLSGIGGQIYKTTDGSAWNAIYAGPSTFDGLKFISDQVGFASRYDSVFMRTSDGGINWDEMSLPFAGARIPNDGMHFIDGQEGWALMISGATPAIYHTENAGNSWALQYQFENDVFAGALTFSDPNTGWAVGENTLPEELQMTFGQSLFGMSFNAEPTANSFLLQFDPNAVFVPGDLAPEPSGFVLLSLGLILCRKRKHAPPGA